MSPSRFASIRRRVVHDTALGARLRDTFIRTLAEEKLLGDLTSLQIDDLRLTLVLQDALSLGSVRSRPTTPAPPTRLPVPYLAPRRMAALTTIRAASREPVSLCEWRARRTGTG